MFSNVTDATKELPNIRLTDVGQMQGHVSVICGLPDMGKVCEEHVKGYIEKADALKNEGVKKVMVMGVDKASVVHSWLKEKYGDACSSVEAIGDDQGAFTRMLGVNINDPDRKQKTQRYACPSNVVDIHAQEAMHARAFTCMLGADIIDPGRKQEMQWCDCISVWCTFIVCT